MAVVVLALVAAMASLTTAGASAQNSLVDTSASSIVARRPALSDDLPKFTLTLPTIPVGSTFGPQNMLNGFGCTGGNLSPAMSWSGAPAGTKSYVLTLFDVDAPTGSGFWHWVVWNIPATITSLPEGAGTVGAPTLPQGGAQGPTDFSWVGYGGPCPPVGDKAHRYYLSVVALDVADIQVPPNLPAAAVNVVMREHALAVAVRAVDVGR